MSTPRTIRLREHTVGGGPEGDGVHAVWDALPHALDGPGVVQLHRLALLIEPVWKNKSQQSNIAAAQRGPTGHIAAVGDESTVSIDLGT